MKATGLLMIILECFPEVLEADPTDVGHLRTMTLFYPSLHWLGAAYPHSIDDLTALRSTRKQGASLDYPKHIDEPLVSRYVTIAPHGIREGRYLPRRDFLLQQV